MIKNVINNIDNLNFKKCQDIEQIIKVLKSKYTFNYTTITNDNYSRLGLLLEDNYNLLVYYDFITSGDFLYFNRNGNNIVIRFIKKIVKLSFIYSYNCDIVNGIILK
jgi:calcineurin-like phosphoesterase